MGGPHEPGDESGAAALALHEVVKAFGGRPVLDGVTLAVYAFEEPARILT